MSQRPVKEMENALVYLQGAIAAAQRGRDSLPIAYPYVKDKLADAELMLEKLGIYEPVRNAIERSELLAQDKQLRQAEDLICDAARTLMERSGTADDLKQLYKHDKS